MSDRPRFDAIVDRCLDDIASGRATVEQCLARWPEQAERLRPLLEPAEALSALPRLEERPVDPARREAFMAALRSTPQQQPHWWTRAWRVPAIPLQGAWLGGAALRVAAPAAAVAAIALLIVFSQPGNPAAAATLTVFQGSVERQEHGAWMPVADGAAITEGDRVRTTEGAYALLTFPDGSTSALDPSTEVSLKTLTRSGPRHVEIEQASGRLWNDVVPDARAGASYVVRTPDAAVEVQGTIFETTIRGGETAVSTVEGRVEVVAGDERVQVARGEIVLAAAQRIAERQSADVTLAAVVVQAPVAAALVSERGQATGVRPDGVTFQQIAGVTSSQPEAAGPQVFDFAGVEPGVYTLYLQRFAEGEGVVVLRTGDGSQRIPVDRGSGVTKVQVRIDRVNGVSTIAALEPTAAPAEQETVKVRIADSERTRTAVALAVRPFDEPPGRRRDEDGEETRRDATPTSTPTERPPRTATPSATRTAEPTGTPAAEFDALRERLTEAAQSGDFETFRRTLDDALPRARDMGGSVLGDFIERLADGDARRGLLDVLGRDADGAQRLRDAIEGLPEPQRGRIKERLAEDDDTAEETPTPTLELTPPLTLPSLLPTPTPTPTPTSTR